MIKIWDSHNKQWLKPTAIFFDGDNKICRVTAMLMEHTDPLSEGWYDLKGKDLDLIALTGSIETNPHLLPKS